MKIVRINGRKWMVWKYRGGWTAHRDYKDKFGINHTGIATRSLRELRRMMHDY
jgi:hypothetical protein